jgi:hypothetical protein
LFSLSPAEAANGKVKSLEICSFCAATPIGINVKGQWDSVEDLLVIADDDDEMPEFAGEAHKEIVKNVTTCWCIEPSSSMKRR